MATKIASFFSSKKFLVVASFLGLYLFSAGASWAIFSYFGGSETGFLLGGLGESRSRINLDLPRTETCPLNGGMFTKIESDIWEERRPITTIIENHLDSRPQSGLSRADIVYEAVAEGGITRFVAVFYCGAAAEDVRIGPIRSVRVYFIDWVAEYGERPLFVHVGGANNICSKCPGGVKPYGQVVSKVDAFKELVKLGWRDGRSGNDIDAGTNAGFPEVWRDPERIPGVAFEHTYMGSTDKLFDLGIERGFGYEDSNGDAWDEGFSKWKFIDDDPKNSPSATRISFNFWDNKPDYDVVWEYDLTNNSYKRFHGTTPHIDMDNKEQLSAKNVAIMFVKEQGPVDKEGHMFYTTTGEGEALIFQNGEVIEGIWEKDTRTDRTKFVDEDGKEISFVRGPIWIEAVPAGNTIDY